MANFVEVLIVLISCQLVLSQDCPQEAGRQWRSFGTKTTYEQARKELSSKPEWSPNSKYTPVFAYGFIRHGIRYPDRDDIVAIKKFVTDNQLPMDTSNCPKDQWPLMAMKPDDDNHLTETGVRELAALAQRVVQKMPDLFSRPEAIDVGVSERVRTSETATAYFTGLAKGAHCEY